MKIAIPVVDTNDHKYSIAPGFNTTPYLCVYDSYEGMYTWMHTDEVLEKGDNIISYFRKNDFGAIITSMMKPMALTLFGKLGINVYKSESLDLIANIMSYEHDELRNLTADDALSETHLCGGACNSCSSDTCSTK